MTSFSRLWQFEQLNSAASSLVRICVVVGATELNHAFRPGGIARTNSGWADGPVLHSLVISQGESRIEVLRYRT